MNYIPVLSLNQNDKIVTGSILKLCKSCLISIIAGLHQKEFGIDTLTKIKQKIREFKEVFKDYDYKLYIDSGGYSIIVGDVNPKDFVKFIECYHDYLVSEKDTYDYIFSLDIPISLKYKDVNNVKTIYELNKLSLSRSKYILLNDSYTRDKFYFVWHFKILKQYRIWDKIYHELDLNDIMSHNQSVGGLVGLKGIVNINFTPFTGMCFRMLHNYLQKGDFTKPLRIHILGVYIRSFRFCICFLEKLFNKILEKYNSYCIFTYDSVNYLLSSYLKSRDLDIYCFNGESIEWYNTNKYVPDNIIETVYEQDYDYIKAQLNRLQNNEQLDKIQIMCPINIYSNIQIDNFFNTIIDKYDLLQSFLNTTNYSKFKIYLDSVCHALESKHGLIFTRSLTSSIKEDFKYIYSFFSSYNDFTKLDNLLVKTIHNINFPFDLSE